MPNIMLRTLILVVSVVSVCSQQNYARTDGEDGSYAYSYAVQDDYGNDYGHNSRSDGNTVTGEYHTLLPDGRVQLVRYQADALSGFRAQVSYSGGISSQRTEIRPRPIIAPQRVDTRPVISPQRVDTRPVVSPLGIDTRPIISPEDSQIIEPVPTPTTTIRPIYRRCRDGTFRRDCYPRIRYDRFGKPIPRTY